MSGWPTNPKLLGKEQVRYDGPIKVGGSAKFTSDMQPVGCSSRERPIPLATGSHRLRPGDFPLPELQPAQTAGLRNSRLHSN